MSDDIEAGETETKVPEMVAYLEDKDWFLKELVSYANIGLGMGVTLIVDGAIVSGTLIGGRRYFEEMGKLITGGDPAELPGGADLLKRIGDGWTRRGDGYQKPADADESWVAPDPSFIHVENARIFAPGGNPIPGNKGVLWRCKLNSINGFSLGALQQS